MTRYATIVGTLAGTVAGVAVWAIRRAVFAFEDALEAYVVEISRPL